jgi:hypothetical protein
VTGITETACSIAGGGTRVIVPIYHRKRCCSPWRAVKKKIILNERIAKGVFMMIQSRHRFLVVLWFVIAADLSAQEKPVLTAGIVQNFIENLETMDTAFSDIEEEEDFLSFAEEMNAFQESLAAYLYSEDDGFSAFRTAFLRTKNVRASSVEQVFSTFGLGSRGIEVFFVITLGMTIGLMERQIETVLSEADPDVMDDLDSDVLNKLESMQNKLVMMRSLIHPDDMAVMDKNLDALLELF